MIYRAVRRFTAFKAMVGRETFHWIERPIATEFHGSSYGGWAVVKDSLDRNSVVYSIGIGRDASFDRSLISRYGLKIYAYDPTPKSISWVRARMRMPEFIFHPVAMSERDGTLTFFEPDPKAADQVSASVLQVNKLSRSFKVPCQTFQSMLNAHGHSNCDVLKMDIEGTEYPVLHDLCESGMIKKVKQLLVEFHHFLPGVGVEKTNLLVQELRNNGFQIAWISRTNHEYLFVRSDIG